MNAAGQRLQPDEVPTLHLPVLTMTTSRPTPRRPPKERAFEAAVPDTDSDDSYSGAVDRGVCANRDICTQAGECAVNVEKEAAKIREEIDTLKKQVNELEQQVSQQKFSLHNIQGDDTEVSFYTSFPSYGALQAFCSFLGSSVDDLSYSKFDAEKQGGKGK